VRAGESGVWSVLTVPEAGGRYFFFPNLVLVVALVWTAVQRWASLARIAASGLLAVLLLVGVRLDWRYDPFPDLQFADHAARFESAPVGARITIPVNPEGWTMTLVKR